MSSSGTATTMAPAVRYACRCGHWAPVGRMFFSDLCQKLVCRRASCSVEEFESYYCAYLLVNLPSKEASVYQNRSSRCFACVACGSVLSTVFHDARRKFFFACAHCHWDSLDVGLLEDDPDTLLMTAVARERETDHEDLFHTLLSHHATLAAANSAPSSASSTSASARGGVGGSSSAAMGRRLSLAAAGRSSSLQSLAGTMKELQREQQMKKFRLQRMAEMGTWKYEHALERVHERAQWLEAQRHEHEWPELKPQLARFSELEAQDDDGDRALEAVAAQGDMDAVSALPQRLLMPLEQPRDVKQLFPHRPLLRVKRTWRCVESIKRGSAGILVKPQISPMSGDSSLPVPASWFKKANLGVHFVPIFTFQVLPKPVAASMADDGLVRFDCVLLIENPLDTPVQLVCQPREGDAHHAKVLLEDATPIVLGAYEDPTIADAFAGDSRGSSADAGASRRNRHLVSTVRNLAKFRVPLEVSANAPTNEITFRLQVEMLKIDEALQEPIMDSLFSLAVEFSSPLVAVSA